MCLKIVVPNALNIVNLHICICTRWLFLIRNRQCMVMNHLKINTRLCARFLNRFTPGQTFIICCLVIVSSVHVRPEVYSSSSVWNVASVLITADHSVRTYEGRTESHEQQFFVR